MTDGSARIRELNDALRIRGPSFGGWLITAGVQAFAAELLPQVIVGVQAFDGFSRDNDPHGEHDFGSFELQGEMFFWKIDYYDTELRYASPDPGNPDVTRRVLTIMLASEY